MSKMMGSESHYRLLLAKVSGLFGGGGGGGGTPDSLFADDGITELTADDGATILTSDV